MLQDQANTSFSQHGHDVLDDLTDCADHNRIGLPGWVGSDDLKQALDRLRVAKLHDEGFVGDGGSKLRVSEDVRAARRTLLVRFVSSS